MRKILLIAGLVLFALFTTLFILRFVIGGPEDDWLCVDGQWIKHGAPSAPMPEEGCGN